MTTTLKVSTTTVQLHPDLYWSDELNWHPVEQTVERTVTGALIVQVSTRVAGRPITLEPEDDNSAWMTRSVVDQLRTWAATPGQVMELTLHGSARDVIFRHQDEGKALEAEPVVFFSDSDSTDFYRCTLRLMEI